ncbi:MAG: WD40 repeat domain-containing protein [Chromatiales bacterium]|nr:WD40 repeat domain-containing protein [Chromatiales bacterium]
MNGVLCGSEVTWEQTFVPESDYENLPPHVVCTADGYVFVSANGLVSPGVLTLTPTVHGPTGDVVLEPLVLEIGASCSCQDLRVLYQGSSHDYIYSTDFSRDGSLVAYGLSFGVVVFSTTYFLEVFSHFNGGEQRAVRFSPTGDFLALVPYNYPYFIRVFSTTTWSEVAAVPVTHPGVFNHISFSPDGDLLLSNAYDVIDGIEKNVVINTSDWSKNHVDLQAMDFAFHPDGGYVVVVNTLDDTRLFAYSTSSWDLLFEVPKYADYAINRCSFSRDGRFLALGYAVGGAVALVVLETTTWSAVYVQENNDYPGYPGYYISLQVDSIEFSHDNKLLAVTYDNYGDEENSPAWSILCVESWEVIERSMAPLGDSYMSSIRFSPVGRVASLAGVEQYPRLLTWCGGPPDDPGALDCPQWTTPISEGQTITGEWDVSVPALHREDSLGLFYCITVAEAAPFIATLQDPAGEWGGKMYLLDASGRLVFAESEMTEFDQPVSLVVALNPGKYVLEVTGPSGNGDEVFPPVVSLR